MDEERVQYSYTGDVSSLREATQEAIGLLDQYESTIKRLAASDKFSVGKTAFTGFQRTINGLIKQVNSLTDIVNKSSMEVQRALEPDVTSLRGAIYDVSDALSYLGTSSKLTSDDVKFLTAYLKDARTTFDLVTGRARALGTSFAQVSHMADTFDPMTAKMQSFEDKASTAIVKVDEIADSFRRMGSSLEPANYMWDDLFTSDAALLAQLEQMYAQMNKETEAIGSEDKALKKKNSTLQLSTTLHNALRSAVSKLGSRFKSEISKITKFAKSLDKTKQIAQGLKTVFRTLVVSKLGQWMSSAVESSIDLYENFNLFKVAMGDSVDEGLAFVDQMSEIYGMDPSNLYEHIGYFYQLTDAIGMSSKASSTLSLSLTKAATDLASLFNTDIQTVVDDLSSGMQGMTKSVRKYGMDIRSTTLEQTALSLGITEQVESMTEADRQALRFITMMEQASNATSQVTEDVDGSTTSMGDFARTIETPANQLRVLKEQITQLGRVLGDFVVSKLEIILPLLNGTVIALRMMIAYVATLAGVFNDVADESDNVSTGSDVLDDVTDSAEEAAAALTKVTAPFDELNTLIDDASTDGEILDPRLEEAITNMSLGLDNIKMKANEIRDQILEFFGFTVQDGEIVAWSREVFEQGLEELEGSIPQLAKKMATKINKMFIGMYYKTIVNDFGSVLSSAINASVAFISELDIQSLGKKIGDFITSGMDEIDFYNLGKLCATKFKIGTDLLIGIVDAMSEETEDGEYEDGWEKLGENIALWLAGAMDSIDWSKLGKATNDLVLGLFKMIITAISKTDWEKIGTQIAEFLNELDLTGIFESLLKLMTAIFGAIGDAFAALWDNADPETKAALTAAGLVALGAIVVKVVKKVGSLTDAFKGKNSELEKQTGLESAAAKALSTNFQPALMGTLAAALLTSEALGNLNINLGNLSPEPAKAFSTATTEALAGATSTATATAGALESVNSTAGALNAQPVESFATTATTSLSPLFAKAWNTYAAMSSMGTAANALDPSTVESFATNATGSLSALSPEAWNVYAALANVGITAGMLDPSTVNNFAMGAANSLNPLFVEAWNTYTALADVDTTANALDPSNVESFVDSSAFNFSWLFAEAWNAYVALANVYVTAESLDPAQIESFVNTSASNFGWLFVEAWNAYAALARVHDTSVLLDPTNAAQFAAMAAASMLVLNTYTEGADGALGSLSETLSGLDASSFETFSDQIATGLVNMAAGLLAYTEAASVYSTEVPSTTTTTTTTTPNLSGVLSPAASGLLGDTTLKVNRGLSNGTITVPNPTTSTSTSAGASVDPNTVMTTVGAGIAISQIGNAIWSAITAAGETAANAAAGFWSFMNTDILELWAKNNPASFNGVGPKMATGGVVTGPTRALIGEGHYSEAVIPLENSPQMRELVSEIADAVSQRDSSNRPIELKLYIGGREWDAFTYESSQRGKDLIGAQPITIGG